MHVEALAVVGFGLNESPSQKEGKRRVLAGG